jgi:hypothetical protein
MEIGFPEIPDPIAGTMFSMLYSIFGASFLLIPPSSHGIMNAVMTLAAVVSLILALFVRERYGRSDTVSP